MIQLNGIQYRYPGGKWILKGINLFIKDGEYVVVCGASGSGKSTLGYLFNGLIPHFFGGTLKGSVSVNHAYTHEMSVSDLFSDVGLVLQNSDAQLFNSTVENEIAFGLESLGLPGKEIDVRISEISEMVHIENLLDRSPETLSGGEKRLVAIASVLCLNPSVLILDEPYANLDWEGAGRIRDILREIHQRGRSVVVIEQKVGSFMQDTTRCLIMDKGSILFDGEPKQAQGVLYREHLVTHYPKKKRNSHAKESLLTVMDLSHRIGDREILKGISLEIRRGETVAIIGKNGSGKTTLIKHLNGLLEPTEGEVIFRGERIRGKVPSEMATDVGLSFQNPNDQFFKERVMDELLVGPKKLKKEEDSWVEEVLDIFDLHELLNRSPYRLSEGEKKRVAISSILTMRPMLLVLDEPTIGQDGRFKKALVSFLAALEDHGLTTLIVTHDLDFAQATADRWIVLLDGKVVGDGSPQELLSDEELIRMGALPGQDA